MTDLFGNTVYIAFPDYLDQLCQELGEVELIEKNLVFSRHKAKPAFAADIWIDPVITSFASISEGTRILRAAGPFWFLNPVNHVRRSTLIAEGLRKLPNLAHHFPVKRTLPLIGCFSLLDAHTMVFATKRSKTPPLGDFLFIEDKLNPPNRAYLKLWEALSLLPSYPKPGEHAIDLGASPGGWTQAMQSLGVHVTAIDKAPLDPRIANLPNVSFRKQSAFALEPSELDKQVDWLLCDVACYPERTYDLINKWISSKKAKRLIFTIKLQGKTDLKSIEPFKNIPDSYVIRLVNNKHEVTFFYGAMPGCDK